MHKALMTDITATWCPPCGDWGSPAFEEATEANSDNAVAMSLHASSSDPMYHATARAIADVTGFGGYPTLSIDLQGDYFSASQLTSAAQAVNATPTVGGSAAILRVNGDQIEIDATAKFFEETTGDYYLGVYVMENGIVEDQNTSSGYVEMVHDHVLRTGATASPFGDMAATGSISANQTFNASYTVSMSPAWNADNLYVATILWKRTGSTYSVVNCN